MALLNSFPLNSIPERCNRRESISYICVIFSSIIFSGCSELESKNQGAKVRRVILINTIEEPVDIIVQAHDGQEIILDDVFSLNSAGRNGNSTHRHEFDRMIQTSKFSGTFRISTPEFEVTSEFDFNTVEVQEENSSCFDIYAFVEPGPDLGIAPRHIQSCD